MSAESWQSRANDLMFIKSYNLTETKRLLDKEGYIVSLKALSEFKEKAPVKALISYQTGEVNDYMLESFDRVKLDFESLASKTKALLRYYEGTGQYFEQMLVMRELKDQLVIAIKCLGKFQSSVNIRAGGNVNMVNISDFAAAFKKQVYSWYQDMEVEFKGGKIIFNKPTPEFIDEFIKWRNAKLLSSKKAQAYAAEHKPPVS
jgi:hypothetical protein